MSLRRKISLRHEVLPSYTLVEFADSRRRACVIKRADGKTAVVKMSWLSFGDQEVVEGAKCTPGSYREHIHIRNAYWS